MYQRKKDCFRKNVMILYKQDLELVLCKQLVDERSLCEVSDDHFAGDVDERVGHSLCVLKSLLNALVGQPLASE
jgi:hypothetical protein